MCRADVPPPRALTNSASEDIKYVNKSVWLTSAFNSTCDIVVDAVSVSFSPCHNNIS